VGVEPPAPELSVPELSVVVLCYGAEEDTPAVVEPLRELLEQAAVDYELVLVANAWPGRGDRTPAVAAALAHDREQLRVVAREKLGGMGWDMRSGLEAARGEFLVVIDGDGQVPVQYALDVYRTLTDTGADIVKGRRYERGDGGLRRLNSFCFNLLFRAVFGTRGLWDVNGRPKGFTRDAWEQLDLRTDDWFTDAEITLKAHRLGLSIVELPVVFLSLETRPSFVGLGTAREFLANMVRWRTGRHPALTARPLPRAAVKPRAGAGRP
jgi:glycosyltransferase involved in cell wall biosynthesis